MDNKTKQQYSATDDTALDEQSLTTDNKSEHFKDQHSKLKKLIEESTVDNNLKMDKRLKDDLKDNHNVGSGNYLDLHELPEVPK